MAQARLLLADDDRIILTTFGEGLRNAGYEVIEVDSGEAALKVVAEKQVDLVILDVDMPGITGIETAYKMRSLGVPVIFLTAYDSEKMVEAAVAEGALGYIIKPIDVAKVIPTIKTALERAGDLQELKKAQDRLNAALDTGKVVNVVVGMIMERYSISQDEAFELLRQKARSERRKVREVAADMVNAWKVLSRLNPGCSSAGKKKR
ncbi:MAG TPA: response regulator [Sedimenticola sp.]|nr:response regulator [Sedimenticola sp.]